MTWYDLTCPWCGVRLRSPDLRIGMVLGCPNQTGGCGRFVRQPDGRKVWVPLQLRIARLT